MTVDLIESRERATATLADLKRRSAQDILAGKAPDVGPVMAAQAALEALDYAESEQARRDREAAQSAHDARQAECRAELSSAAAARQEAVGRAERATRELAAALKDEREATPSPASAVRADLQSSWVGRELAERWNRAGLDGMVRRVQDAARQILAPIPDSRDLVDSFEAMPADIRHAIMSELANGPRSFVPPVSDAGVKNFRRIPEQAQLVQEWGFNAPRKIASIRARLWAIIDNLPEGGAAEFNAWCNGIPGPEWKQVLRGLAR